MLQALFFLFVLLGAARAEAKPSLSSPRSASPLAKQSPLFWTGAALFGAGYVPNFLLATPSAVGGVARGFYTVFLYPIYLIDCHVWNTRVVYEANGSFHEEPAPTPSRYFCGGQHGAVHLAIPLAGPILFSHFHPRDALLNPRGSDLPPAVDVLLYASAGAQLVGVGLAVAGLLTSRAKDPTPSQAERGGPTVSLMPMVSPATLGVNLTVTSF